MQEFSKDICNNCELPIRDTDNFCHSCGQKNTSGKLTVRGLLSEFVDNYLHLNTKLPRTLFALFFKPGKLTKIYFAGKHQSYLRPVRLFGVSTILFLAVLAFQLSQQHFNQNIYQVQKQIIKDETKKELLTEIDSSFDVTIANVVNSDVEMIVDSTLQPFRDTVFHESKDTISISMFRIGNVGSTVTRISQEDFFTLEGKEIVKKYGITDFRQQLVIIQTTKVAQETDGFSRYVIGLVPWMLFLMIPFFAMLLKLVYIRRKQFYVEHLVFTFHVHSFLFLFFLVFLIPFQILNGIYDNPLIVSVGKKVQLVWMIGIAIYLFVAMKRFYGQSIGKTLLKYFILSLAYLVIFFLFSSIFIVASLLLF